MFLGSRLQRQLQGWLWLAAVLSLVVAGCAETGTRSGEQAPASAVQDAPLTLTNCNRTVTIASPPQRAVALDQVAIDVLLALGLQSRMAGASLTAGYQPLPEYAAAYSRVPKLADQYPSQEVLLGASPDLAIANLDSYAFDAQQGRSRDVLESRGMLTYAMQCATEGTSLKLFYQRVGEVGKIFAVEDGAQALVTKMQSSLKATTDAVSGVTPTRVFFYSAGEDAPTTAGGSGYVNEVITAAGGVNIFADRTFPGLGKVSWEEVVARDPEVIIIRDFTGDKSPEEKRAFLESFPSIAEVSAVKNKRFLVVPFVNTTGIRIPDTVRLAAEFLHSDRF